MAGQLSTLYGDLPKGSYDCVDRVVLNAYFGMGQTGGGLRLWWRLQTSFVPYVRSAARRQVKQSVQSKATKFGLKLAPDDGQALIAFLRTL